MKRSFIILVTLIILLPFISKAEAAPQFVCGYVVSLIFMPATSTQTYQVQSSTGLALSGGMPGAQGGIAYTADRELGKIALLYKLNGQQLCVTYDMDAPAYNNITQLQGNP